MLAILLPAHYVIVGLENFSNTSITLEQVRKLLWNLDTPEARIPHH